MHLDLHRHAVEDLERIWQEQPAAAAAVVAALEQMQADPGLIDKLTRHGENEFAAARLNVKRWQRVRPRKGDLWRFRVLDTPATSYRVVYGYHYQTRQVCVLAVVHRREFDYDDLASDLARRILADWAAL